MNKYIEMLHRHQEEVNALPIKFAFSDKQFTEGMAKLGLSPTDTDKIYALGETGGFYRVADAKLIRDTFNRHIEERQKAIEDDTTGKGYICEMFRYELQNHEYAYTGDLEDTIESLGLTMKEINDNPALKHGLELARKKYIRDADENDWY